MGYKKCCVVSLHIEDHALIKQMLLVIQVVGIDLIYTRIKDAINKNDV